MHELYLPLLFFSPCLFLTSLQLRLSCDEFTVPCPTDFFGICVLRFSQAVVDNLGSHVERELRGCESLL